MSTPPEPTSRLYVLRETCGETMPAGTASRHVLDALLRQRRFIVAFTILATLAAAAATFLTPESFQSRAALLIPKATRVDMAQDMASDSLLERLLPSEGKKHKEQTILAFLHSSALAKRLIEQDNLLPLLYRAPLDRLTLALRRGPGGTPSLDLAVQERRLADIFQAAQRANQPVLDLSMEAASPAQARLLLRHVIAALGQYLRDEYVSDAGRERRHLEALSARAEETLVHWERAAPDARTTGLMIQRNLLTARKVHLELRLRLAAARAEEIRQAVDFKIMDPPSLPVLALRPKRIQAALIALFVSFFAACALALVRESLSGQSHSAAPESAEPDPSHTACKENQRSKPLPDE